MRGLLLTAFTIFSTLYALAQDSQNAEIAKLTSGKYTVHKVIEKSRNNYKFETASKPWPVEFSQEGNVFTEILIKRAGIIDEKYVADLKKYPAYYDNSASEIVVTVINKKIYYYKWSIKSGSEIVYILSEKSASSYETEKALWTITEERSCRSNHLLEKKGWKLKTNWPQKKQQLIL